MNRGYLALRIIALAIGAMPWHEALANPTGPTPVRGVASISGLGTPSVTVNTNDAKAIINWQGFSIDGLETTRFTQPSAASAVLNRVTSTQPSSILGSLQSNGQVFLINPNGIFFGAGATVDVAGFVASSLNLANDDFISGRLRFTETPGAGQVVTSGLTRAPDPFGGPGTTINAPGGFVYLVAPSIINGGDINATEVTLAAARSVEIINPGTPDVTVNISAGPENAMLNFGAISGGRINIFAGVMHISGGGEFGSAASVSASTAVAGADGTVTLRATGDINVGPEPGFFADGPRIEASKRVKMIADGNITMSCPECRIDAPALVQGCDIFLKGNNITQGANASLVGRNLTIAASGDVDLGNFSNSVERLGGTASGDVVFNNSSSTLKVNGLWVEPPIRFLSRSSETSRSTAT